MAGVPLHCLQPFRIDIGHVLTMRTTCSHRQVFIPHPATLRMAASKASKALCDIFTFDENQADACRSTITVQRNV
jgi:hypothetical protein